MCIYKFKLNFYKCETIKNATPKRFDVFYKYGNIYKMCAIIH